MSICENVKAHTDYETDTIGFIDTFDYMNKLYYKKLAETDENIDEKFSAFNSITSLKNLSTNMLKTKILEIRQTFENHYKNIQSRSQKLKDVLTILDETLPYYQEKVDKIKKMLRNKVFMNDINIIKKRAMTGELTFNEKQKHSYYTYLNDQLYHLEKIVIGSSQNLMINEVKRANDLRRIKESFYMITDDMKTIYTPLVKNEKQGFTLDKMMDLWQDEEISKIIADIDLDFDREIDERTSSLKAKVVRAIMNFTGMKYKQVKIIMSDKNFRNKMFKNANVEDIRHKLTSTNDLLIEYKQITSFLQQYDNKIHVCPYCGFSSYVPIAAALHIAGTHKRYTDKEMGLLKKKNKINKTYLEYYSTHGNLIGKYDFIHSLEIVEPKLTEDGYSTVYTNKVFANKIEAIHYIKSVYLAPELSEDIVQETIYVSSIDRRIADAMNKISEHDIGTALPREFISQYDDVKMAVASYRQQTPRQQMKNKLWRGVSIQVVKESLRKELEVKYNTFLKNGLISRTEYDNVIKQIIKSEVSKIDDADIKYNGKSFSKARVQGSKNMAKKHISRVVLEKIMDSRTAYSAITNVSEMLEKLFGEDIQTIVQFEKMMNNMINYETNEPFDYIRKMMNNMIDFMIYMSNVNLENAHEKIKNMVFRDFFGMKLYSSKSKSKADRKRGVLGPQFLSAKTGKGLTANQKDNYAAILSERINDNEEIEKMINNATIDIEITTKELIPDSEFNILNYTMILLYAGLTSEEITAKLAEVKKEVSIEVIVIDITNLLITGDGETTDVFNEMISSFSGVDTEQLMIYKKQFNSIFELLTDMYTRDLHTFDLNRMKTTKSYEDRHREMSLGLVISTMSHYMGKMMGTNKLKNYITNTLKMTPFYLTKESKFLKMAVLEKIVIDDVEELKLEEEEEEQDAVDTLLNDFMELDDDEDIVEDDEDSELMTELFGEDEE